MGREEEEEEEKKAGKEKKKKEREPERRGEGGKAGDGWAAPKIGTMKVSRQQAQIVGLAKAKRLQPKSSGK